MYPILAKIGPFTLYSYGLMVALGILTAIFLIARELRRKNIDPDIAYSLGLAATLGGIIGARLFYVVGRWEQFSGAPLKAIVLQSGGLVWYGGLLGGALACLLVIWRRRLLASVVADAVAPALALGHAIGRIGCLLNGDDYGRATNLPWAMTFPEGSPPTTVAVHPTQIYESLLHFGIFLLLWFLRKRVKDGGLFWLAILVLGTERFFIEFLRTNQIIWAPFTIYHVLSVPLIIIAAGILWRRYGLKGFFQPSLAGAGSAPSSPMSARRKPVAQPGQRKRWKYR